MRTRYRRHRGFSLIEVLVALLLLSVVVIGILQLLDLSSETSKLESALAETQENVRFAAYHVMRHARMMGGAGIPMAEGGAWIGAEIISNGTTTATTTAFGSLSKDRASDVLVAYGFFDRPLFAVGRFDVDLATSPPQVTIREYSPQDATGRLINDLGGIPASDAFESFGLALMGERQWQVAGVQSGASVTSSNAYDRELVIPFQGGSSPWEAVNPTGSYATPTFDTYQVGIMSCFAFWTENGTLWRRRVDSGGGTVDEPVAVNIGGLQLAIGIDNDDNGAVDAWLQTPTAGAVSAAQPIALRITVLGSTPFQVSDWLEPAATFTTAEDLVTTAVDRSRKWRTLQVTAALRNFVL